MSTKKNPEIMTAELEDLTTAALDLHRQTGGKGVIVTDGKRKAEIKAGLDDGDKKAIQLLIGQGLDLFRSWNATSSPFPSGRATDMH